MPAILRLLLATTLAVGAFSFTPAPALTYASCTTNYTAAGQGCMFTPAGPNLSISATSQFPGGGILKVRITDPTGTVNIVECTGYSQCWAHFGPHHTGTDSVGPPATGPLLCQVVSGSSGYVGCASGI